MPVLVRAVPSSGLSPRVRGNPVGNRNGVCLGGSIPACAGEPYGARRS